MKGLIVKQHLCNIIRDPVDLSPLIMEVEWRCLGGCDDLPGATSVKANTAYPILLEVVYLRGHGWKGVHSLSYGGRHWWEWKGHDVQYLRKKKYWSALINVQGQKFMPTSTTYHILPLSYISHMASFDLLPLHLYKWAMLSRHQSHAHRFQLSAIAISR